MARAEVQSENSSTAVSPHIVVISDEYQQTEAWIASLTESGLAGITFHVIWATSVDHVDSTCHLVLIDNYVQISKPSDLELVPLISELRRKYTNPIILLTSEGNEDFAVRAYRAGADECIVRPISLSLLKAKLLVWLAWARKKATSRRAKRANPPVTEPTYHAAQE